MRSEIYVIHIKELVFINVRRNSVHIYHKGSAIDKYMDTYLIVAYTLTDLQIQFRYIVFVWIMDFELLTRRRMSCVKKCLQGVKQA